MTITVCISQCNKGILQGLGRHCDAADACHCVGLPLQHVVYLRHYNLQKWLDVSKVIVLVQSEKSTVLKEMTTALIEGLLEFKYNLILSFLLTNRTQTHQIFWFWQTWQMKFGERNMTTEMKSFKWIVLSRKLRICLVKEEICLFWGKKHLLLFKTKTTNTHSITHMQTKVTSKTKTSLAQNVTCEHVENDIVFFLRGRANSKPSCWEGYEFLGTAWRLSSRKAAVQHSVWLPEKQNRLLIYESAIPSCHINILFTSREKPQN